MNNNEYIDPEIVQGCNDGYPLLSAITFHGILPTLFSL